MEASVWRFVVKPGGVPDFEAMFGPHGDWARFFQGSPAYRGSFLLRDQRHGRGYVVIDVWDSRSDRDAHCRTNADRYAALEQAGEELAESEEDEGWFESVDDVLARL